MCDQYHAISIQELKRETGSQCAIKETVSPQSGVRRCALPSWCSPWIVPRRAAGRLRSSESTTRVPNQRCLHSTPLPLLYSGNFPWLKCLQIDTNIHLQLPMTKHRGLIFTYC